MRFRKIVLAVIALFFAFSSFQFFGLEPAFGLSSAIVSVDPDVIGQYGEYNINFVTDASRYSIPLRM